jgi:tetratricopeptide (TPR) repeat protein
MEVQDVLPPFTGATAGQVVVLEAPQGRARREALSRWLDAAGSSASQRWLVSADAERAGIWAGLSGLLDALVPELEKGAPELLERHDSELLSVLPELGERLHRRHVPLTESVTPEESVRNYAADRAYRIPHGLINLLDAWHTRTGGGQWALAVDDFDRRGALVGRFFRELARRRAGKLGLTLLVAVEPGQGAATAAELAPYLPVAVARLELPGGPEETVDRAEATKLAIALEAKVNRNEALVQKHIHELIYFWKHSEHPDRSLAWQAAAVGTYNHLGFYEDALRFVPPVQATLPEHSVERHFYTRWSLVRNIFNTYVALGMAEQAHEVLMTEGLPKISDPEERARAHYALAMLYVRYFPERDISLGEKYLEEALEELEGADSAPETKHFLRVFLLNGLALVRHRQGRPQDAIQMSRDGFEDLGEKLPEGSHRLHRSVLLYNAAQVYTSTGAMQDALDSFTAAMEMDPGYSEYYNERGNVYLRLGRFDEAMADYQKAVECSPPYPEVWINMGQAFSMTQRFEDAVRAYSVALDLDPTRHLALVGRAQAFSVLGRPEGAMADYDAAIAVDPAHPLVFANRAVLRYGSGRIAESVEDLDQAIAMVPDNPGLYRNRSVALKDLGRAEAEAADLETYLRLAPGAPDRAAVEQRLAELSPVAEPA